MSPLMVLVRFNQAPKMEEYLLSSKDFSASIKRTLSHLVNDTSFTDVTLACNDDKQLKAHKVILGGSSHFFRKILLNNPHQHPVIYLKGLQFEDIKVMSCPCPCPCPCPNAPSQAVLQYLYLGETRISKEQVSSFLDTARELQVEGLGAGIELQEETEKQLNSAEVNMDHSSNQEDGKRVQSDTALVDDSSRDLSVQKGIDDMKPAIIEEESSGKGLAGKELLEPRNTLSCDICGFKSSCLNASNSRTSIKRHKKNAHPNLGTLDHAMYEGSFVEDTQNKSVKHRSPNTKDIKHTNTSAHSLARSILEEPDFRHTPSNDTLTKALVARDLFSEKSVLDNMMEDFEDDDKETNRVTTDNLDENEYNHESEDEDKEQRKPSIQTKKEASTDETSPYEDSEDDKDNHESEDEDKGQHEPDIQTGEALTEEESLLEDITQLNKELKEITAAVSGKIEPARIITDGGEEACNLCGFKSNCIKENNRRFATKRHKIKSHPGNLEIQKPPIKDESKNQEDGDINTEMMKRLRYIEDMVPDVDPGYENKTNSEELSTMSSELYKQKKFDCKSCSFSTAYSRSLKRHSTTHSTVVLQPQFNQQFKKEI